MGSDYVTRDGSSPLARGLPGERAPGRSDGGIIPARAGFTIELGTGIEVPEDHPRSRGVYHRVLRSHEGLRGSSPLARGLRDDAEDGSLLQRIIPARAGFTL